MKLMTAKGVRDFAPEEKIIRNKIVNTLINIFERYGYSPLETPILERYDILAAKFVAGEESDVMKETFRLKDQGGRDLGLRFDLTVPFARFVGMNPNLKMPFKRYQIGRVFRDGPIKLGRAREFWQCDADVVGTASMTAEAELIKLALDFFKEMKFDAYIEINNRKLLQGLLTDCGVDESMFEEVIIIVDKLNKIGAEEVKKELINTGINGVIANNIIDIFNIKGGYEEIFDKLDKKIVSELGVEGLKELKELFSYLNEDDLKNIVLNISLARGFAYYTGTIYEGYLRKSKITSSILGGGRFDKMIGRYIGEKKDYPAVGISFGLDVITEAIKLKGLKKIKTVTKVYIVPINTIKQSFEIAGQLRKNNIKTDIDIVGRGISKNLNYANAMNIPYVILIGEDELSKGKIKLRDMKTGKEEMLSVEEVVDRLK